MDENELRAALRTTVALHPEPPPMQSQAAVAAGRRAARRRNLLAGGGAAAAILAVTLAAIPGQSYFHDGGTGIQAAAEPSAAAPARTDRPAPHASAPSGVPSSDETKPVWPPEASGDATADSGGHYDRGRAVLAELLKVVPAGHTAPTGSVADGIELQSHQAAVEGEHWAYLSTIALRKGGNTGGLSVEVHEPGNGLPSNVCKVAQAFWGRGGKCAEQTVGGSRVGVIAGSSEAWAAYRHSDGTVVYVLQSKATTYGTEAGFTPLTKLPLSTAELAGLAASPQFR